jgi:hypothetical protein
MKDDKAMKRINERKVREAVKGKQYKLFHLFQSAVSTCVNLIETVHRKCCWLSLRSCLFHSAGIVNTAGLFCSIYIPECNNSPSLLSMGTIRYVTPTLEISTYSQRSSFHCCISHSSSGTALPVVCLWTRPFCTHCKPLKQSGTKLITQWTRRSLLQ